MLSRMRCRVPRVSRRPAVDAEQVREHLVVAGARGLLDRGEVGDLDDGLGEVQLRKARRASRARTRCSPSRRPSVG